MIVKIGNKKYDSAEVPIMIIFSDRDKQNITDMDKDCTKYASFPAGMLNSVIEEFMDE